jgi:hypothetical protein
MLKGMRTTLTLDDDVAAALERLCRNRQESMTELANEALRRVLKQFNVHPAPRSPFQTTTVALGPCRLGALDNIAEVLTRAESDGFK